MRWWHVDEHGFEYCYLLPDPGETDSQVVAAVAAAKLQFGLARGVWTLRGHESPAASFGVGFRPARRFGLFLGRLAGRERAAVEANGRARDC
jgi:hypothetical protein